MRECLSEKAEGLSVHLISGETGAGKGLLLEQLAEQGAQVIDLELLAEHRGSTLGELPGSVPPSQKLFESRLAHEIAQFDASKPVFVEAFQR